MRQHYLVEDDPQKIEAHLRNFYVPSRLTLVYRVEHFNLMPLTFNDRRGIHYEYIKV